MKNSAYQITRKEGTSSSFTTCSLIFNIDDVYSLSCNDWFRSRFEAFFDGLKAIIIEKGVWCSV